MGYFKNIRLQLELQVYEIKGFERLVYKHDLVNVKFNVKQYEIATNGHFLMVVSFMKLRFFLIGAS